MAQEFDGATIADDGYVGEPLFARSYTAATIPDAGYVGAPTVQREWDPNSTTEFPSGAPTQATILPESALQVVDLDHQHVAWLPLAKGGYSARGSVGDSGAVLATLAKTDPALASLPAEWILRYWLRGNLIAAAVQGPRNDASIDQSEEAGQEVGVGGPGTFEYLNRAVLRPWREAWAPDMQAHRFGPFHPDSDTSSWGPAYSKAVQGVPSPKWTALPRGWPAPDAHWISGPLGNSSNAPDGSTYFHRHFVAPSTAPRDYAMFWTGDNSAEVWLDGVPITTIQNWQQLQRVDLRLAAGGHDLLVKVDNYVQATGNPTGLLYALYKTDGQGRTIDPPVSLTHPGTGGDGFAWSVLQFPSEPPGWPLGKVLNYLLDQAEDQLGRTFVRTFTETADSAGQPWPVVVDLTIQVGTKIGAAIRQLGEAYCDVVMAPGSWTLHAWNKQSGRVLNLDLDNTGDDACLSSLRHQTAPPSATSLLVRWQDNWLLVERTPPAGYDPRIEHLQVPQVPSSAGAADLAGELLDLWCREQVQYTAEIVPRSDVQVPAVAFRERDSIRLPNKDGTLERVVVQSWSVVTDEDGRVHYQIEAGDLLALEAERIQSWLQRLADGSLEGRTKQALPARPETYAYTAASMAVTSIPFQRDADLVALESNPYPTDGFSRIIDVQARLGTGVAVRGSATDCEVLVNGVVVGTATIPAGHRNGRSDGIGYQIDRDDDVTARIANTGFVVVVVIRFA